VVDGLPQLWRSDPRATIDGVQLWPSELHVSILLIHVTIRHVQLWRSDPHTTISHVQL